MKLTKVTFEEYATMVQGWYEDAEKWNQTLQDTTPHEIVERLKKRIEYLDGWKGIITERSLGELAILQKILGNDK